MFRWLAVNLALVVVATLTFTSWTALRRSDLVAGATASGRAGLIPVGGLLVCVSGTLLVANLVWGVVIVLRRR
jgi:hypothetical protein